ncbi:MAG TPA: hypothetical protein PLE28_00785 [bacterium]|nr:hypothetical protein [bacterium]
MKKNKNNSKPLINNDDLEIIPPNNSSVIIEDENTNNDTVCIDRDKVKVKKNGNLVVGNVNLILNPLKKRNDKYYRNNIWHLIADIFFVLLIVVFVIFIIFANKKFTKDNVSLNINIDNKELSSGSKVSFTLDYQANIDTTNSFIKVALPDDFIIESVSPYNYFNTSTNSFDLGDLKKNSKGQIKINGSVWGELHDRQMISFNYTCDQCGQTGISNYLFYDISQPVLETKLLTEDIIYTNSEFKGILKITNNSDTLIKKATIDLGPDIELKESDLEIKDNALIIEEMASGVSQEINLLAILKTDNNSLEIIPEINANISGDIYSFLGSSTTLNIEKPNLAVDLSSDQKNVNLNEKISYTLNYKNEEMVPAKDIKITLSSGNSNFSLNPIKITSDSKNIQIDDNIITINDLAAEESGSIVLETSFDQRKIKANQSLLLKANVEYRLDGQTISYNVNSNQNKLISRVSATAKAYYYSPQGDQLGVGPLPPAVDMATSYWVFLEFNNSGNDLKNFVLTAELPDNVYFPNEKRVLDGKIIYGEIGKRLAWEIPSILGGNNNYQANFKISLIPDEGDLGTIPDLLKNIKFTVTDAFTGQELSGQIENINTNLKNDKLSSGQGRVTIIN